MNHISVNNIACILVHESRHLMIEKADPKWDENFIEFMCYDYELNFAKKIPNMENWQKIQLGDQINEYNIEQALEVIYSAFGEEFLLKFAHKIQAQPTLVNQLKSMI